MAAQDIVTGSGTTSTVVSLEGFHAILWTLLVVCLFAFAARLYIRYHCFRRLLLDDWIMMFAFALLLSVVAIGQAFLEDLYKEIAFENGQLQPDANLPNAVEKGLHGFGAAMTISLVGISAIKINFLVFFKRLGTQITSYLVFWYIVLVVTIGCGVTNIAMMDYKCVFATFEYLMASCQTRGTLQRVYNFQKVSVSLDVISDALIICFPVVILWNVRISLRKKIILSCTFGLVAFTIAVTIVRGSVFGGAFKSFDNNESKNLNLAWMWFWIFIEFAVAFLIACIISFRALFAQREQRSYENDVHLRQIAWQEQQDSPVPNRLKSSKFVRRARYMHDSLLHSFKTLETFDSMRLPEPESGRFSPTFLTEIEPAHSAKDSRNSLGDSANRN